MSRRLGLHQRLRSPLSFLLLLLISIEAASFLAVRFAQRHTSASQLFYRPPTIEHEAYGDYLSQRDPELGWPSPRRFGGPELDVSGSRRSPAFPEPGEACVSVYGDSFSYGSEVDAQHAWPNVLAQRRDCRVANYAVPGYGTDQAVLRFERQRSDSAPVTILGFYPRDVTRNITRYVHLEFGNAPLGFKPRFVATDDGGLRRLPLPRIQERDLEAFVDDPRPFLDPDELLPGSALGPVRTGLPSSLALLRAATNPRARSRLGGKPSWMPLLQPDHPSQGLAVTTGVMELFARTCRQRGKRCLVLLFPTQSSYRYERRTGRSALEALAERLESMGLPYLDLMPAISAHLGGDSYCTLLTNIDGCHGHFNVSGNRLVADAVAGYLDPGG